MTLPSILKTMCILINIGEIVRYIDRANSHLTETPEMADKDAL